MRLLCEMPRRLMSLPETVKVLNAGKRGLTDSVDTYYMNLVLDTPSTSEAKKVTRRHTALFVLFGNAAKHGRSDGPIRVSVDATPSDERLLDISIYSESPSEDRFRRDLQRIATALKRPDSLSIDIAAVEEGLSGLGKLVGQLRRVKCGDIRLAYMADERASCESESLKESCCAREAGGSRRSAAGARAEAHCL